MDNNSHRPVQVVTIALATTALALAAGTTAARDDTGTSSSRQTLERITIVGDPDRIQEVPGSAQALDQEELDRFNYGDAHRVLRQIPGVNIQEEDGFGLFPNIGMRGTRVERNTRITVMEDGVLISPAPYSAPAAYYFPPVGRMSRVEVLKGSSSIKHGPYTTGGALNLISTPIPDESFAASADISFGSDGGRRNHVWLGGSSTQWGWLVEAYTDESDGFKQLDTSRGGSNNVATDDTGFKRENFLAKLRWNSHPESAIYQEVELKFGVNDTDANETYLGLTREDFRRDPFRRYAGSQVDQIATEHTQYQISHYIAPTDQLDISTTAYYNEFARNWYKLQSVDGASISDVLQNPEENEDAFNWIRGNRDGGADGVIGRVRANNREYYSYGIQTEIGYLFDTGAVNHELEVGIRYHEDEEDRRQWEDQYEMRNRDMFLVDRGRPGTQANRETNARALAGFVQNTMRFGNWTVVPGLRGERIRIVQEDFQRNPPTRSVSEGKQRSNFDVLLPGLGVVYQVNQELSVLAGVHRGFAPTGAGGDGREERSVNYEAGFRYRTPVFRSEVIGFFNDYSNLVGVCTESSGGGCTVGDTFSGGDVEVGGVEATALYDLGAARNWAGFSVPLSLAYTWTPLAEFREAGDFSAYSPWGVVEKGDRLPQIPEHQITASAGVGFGPWSGNLTANFVSSTRATAGSGRIPANDKLESRLLLDVAGEYAFNENVRVFSSIENLTDQEYIAGWRPAGARPGLPRTYWAGVRLRY